MKKLTTEEFIEKARKVHGGKYDYSKVAYVNNSTKVCIVCPEHGEFWMRPKNHMRGDSCPTCARKEVGVANSISHEEFIERVGVLYEGKYDYSKTNYERMHVKVCVICPIHGEFWVTPANHLKGSRCPKCRCDKYKSKSKYFGVGINDTFFQSRTKEHQLWMGIIERCYDEKLHKKFPSYIGCSICEEWRYFSNFKRWFDEHYVEGWCLDKDILFKGNKLYSSSTCCFVPQDINKLFRRNVKSDTIKKRAPILAEKYKHQLEPRVYDALMGYRDKDIR